MVWVVGGPGRYSREAGGGWVSLCAERGGVGRKVLLRVGRKQWAGWGAQGSCDHWPDCSSPSEPGLSATSGTLSHSSCL